MRLAGVPVRFLCYSQKTIKYLKRYTSEDIPLDTEAEYTIDSRNLVFDQVYGEEVLEKPFFEYSALIRLASDVLMPGGRCFIHGAVFIWKEKAWILMGPSGTGKSTQYRNLSELYGHEVFCLNGDKPGLEFREDGQIMVYDSPWRGKEGWGTEGVSYPLAGMFYLCQDDCNQIEELPVHDWIIPIYGQFFSSRDSVEKLHFLSRFVEALLKNIPIRQFKNKGDPDSSRLLYKTIRQMHSKELAGHN